VGSTRRPIYMKVSDRGSRPGPQPLTELWQKNEDAGMVFYIPLRKKLIVPICPTGVANR
jgi:hypothetical protein